VLFTHVLSKNKSKAEAATLVVLYVKVMNLSRW